MTALRRDRIGFVFQSFNLVPTLTALENITLPIAIAGRTPDQPWLDTVIDTLGLRRPAAATGPASCPAASSSASRSAGRWPAGPRSSSATSRPATSTRAPAARCSASCAAVGGRARPDRRHRHARPARGRYADRVLFLADGRIVDELRAPTADAVLDRMKSL